MGEVRERMQVEVEDPGQGGDREERGHGDRPALDLAERVERDPGGGGHVGGATRTTSPLQVAAEGEAPFALVGGQRRANHTRDSNPGIRIRAMVVLKSASEIETMREA